MILIVYGLFYVDLKENQNVLVGFHNWCLCDMISSLNVILKYNIVCFDYVQYNKCSKFMIAHGQVV